MSCNACKAHPELKKRWGCDKPLDRVAQDQKIPDDNGVVHEYYSCPNLFKTKSVDSILSKFFSIKSGVSAPVEHEQQDAKFIEAVEYYNHWENFCIRKRENV